MPPLRLTRAQARRVALAAQGFADPRPRGRIDKRHLRRVIDRVGLLQLGSVNVFVRSHYLPVYARLGPYPRELLDEMSAHVTRPRAPELAEYWFHMASLAPVHVHPLLRWRMERATRDAWGGFERLMAEQPELVDDTYRLVAEQGPVVAGDTGIPRPPPRPGHMWNWHDGKVALEYLFRAGRITTAKRVHFQRYYDLTERVLPAEVIAADTPPEGDAKRELVRIAARALGVGTPADIRDYFRLLHVDTVVAIDSLVAAGELVPVEVDGWAGPAYLWHDARRPRRIEARALLSPFDSLVWFRERDERLFDFRYRIEIYTPEPKRVFGYYVLPFLLGDELVGRVDLKADRRASVLRVQSAWLEPGHDPARVARELAAELTVVAGWLGLGWIEVMPRGDLAPKLSTCL